VGQFGLLCRLLTGSAGEGTRSARIAARLQPGGQVLRNDSLNRLPHLGAQASLPASLTQQQAELKIVTFANRAGRDACAPTVSGDRPAKQKPLEMVPRQFRLLINGLKPGVNEIASRSPRARAPH